VKQLSDLTELVKAGRSEAVPAGIVET
jgi:hypothetical protein